MSKVKRKEPKPELDMSGLTEGFESIKSNLQPWLDRSTEMLQARPAVTLGVAVGTGFLLGVTMFSRPGRFVMMALLGVGAEMLQQSMRTNGNERPALSAAS